MTRTPWHTPASTTSSASQLYHYFTDKDDLVRAVIAHQTEGVLDAQRPLLDQLDSFAALHQWRDLLVDLQEQRHRCSPHCRAGCSSPRPIAAPNPIRTALDAMLAHIHTYATEDPSPPEASAGP